MNFGAIAAELSRLGYGGCYSMEFAGVADEDEIERVLTRMADHFV